MLDPVAELIRIEVALAEMTGTWADRILSAPPEGAPDATIWSDYGFKWPAYALAHLYRTRHPANPLVGRDWCLDLALQLVDKAVGDWHYRRGEGLAISSREVPHYIAAGLMDWLGPAVGDARRAEWTAHAEAFAEAEALGRPFGFTGNYHDTWRILALMRLGIALKRPEWTEMALWLFQRMIERQTPAGFFEEGRHHGPSMRYNGLMLPTLAWAYRLTGDATCRRAAAQLAAFMGTFTYPDAITVGPFDGRNSPMLAFFPNCAGLELAPEGRVVAARAFRLWHDLGVPERIHKAVESTRDAVRLAFYAADTCVYLSDYVPEAERAAAVDAVGTLPVDADGTVEQHAVQFDGLLHRRGPWVVALSGQNSDIARRALSIFRLERESRFELWHEEARLVVGGGHSLLGAEVPYANAVLDTGYAGPVEFGQLDVGRQDDLISAHASPRAGGAVKGWRRTGAGDRREAFDLLRSYYMAREATTRMADGVPALRLVFAHGVVRFRFRFAGGDGVEIVADWDVRRLERLCLQVPVVVWLGAEVSVDGAAQAPPAVSRRPVQGDRPAPLEVRKEVCARGGPFHTRTTLTVPEGVPTRVHYPLPAVPTFSNFFEDDPFQPQFGVALVSCQWTRPPRTGEARFGVTVRAT